MARSFGQLVEDFRDGKLEYREFERRAKAVPPAPKLVREQLERAYPQFEAFLREKLAWDPDERFQSDWYRHYRSMFLGR